MPIDVQLTLDAKLGSRSAVWCASIQLAWGELRRGVLGEATSNPGDPFDRLDASRLVEAHLPEGSYFAAAGWVRDGILERIKEGMAARFPQAPSPQFPMALMVAYAYLEACVAFRTPFIENEDPLTFRTATGGAGKVKCFGIPRSARYLVHLSDQVLVLHARQGSAARRFQRDEFILDLDRYSAPNQVVLAVMPRPPTLADAIEYAEARIVEGAPGRPLGRAGLEIPSVAFEAEDRFPEIEGRPLSAKGVPIVIDVAQQRVKLRLDRGGARVESDASFLVLGLGESFVVDGPFLLYMKKCGSTTPFLALWVEDLEPLEAFPSS